MSSLLHGDLMVLEAEPSTTVNAPLRRPLAIAEPNSTGVRLDLVGERALYAEVRELLRAFHARDEVTILSLFYGKSTYFQEKIIKAFDLLPENRWGAEVEGMSDAQLAVMRGPDRDVFQNNVPRLDVVDGAVAVSYERNGSLYSKEAPTGPVAREDK